VSGTLTSLSGRGDDGKLATRIASQIVDDVVARGWPVGEVLGPSTEFLERYEVSRAVFREAVRILENQQVARTRRGPGGGLVVVQPSVHGIIDAAILYLYRVDARLDEVFEARIVLEEAVVEMVPVRIDDQCRQHLSTLLDDEKSGRVTDPRAFHSLLASLTGNPALELFVDILSRVSTFYLRDPGADRAGVSDRTRRAHHDIARAVLDGDITLARKRMRRHLETELETLRHRRLTRQTLPSGVPLGAATEHKRAEQVAREIFVEVAAERLDAGVLLGSEPELMARHGVSRAVFREAVRLLEHHQVATMRRGPGGGLFVTEPNPIAVSDVVALYLASRGTGVGALAELRVAVELALVDLTIDQWDPSSTAALEASVELDEGDEQVHIVIHNLHAAIADFADNRALQLVALVLIRLTRFHQHRALEVRDGAEIQRDVKRAHAGIASAVEAGDRALAKKRMRRHLEVLAAHLR
jgi:DNA-binding FadR family transcriptional regulator